MFEVGVTPDFYVDAKGGFEAALTEKLDPVDGVSYRSMPAMEGKRATPEALDPFDAIFCPSMKVDAESLRGVERTAVIARWGVGYDSIDTQALTEADVALAITPGAVRRPVAEAILTFVFALSKNLRTQDKVTREGGWRGEAPLLVIAPEGGAELIHTRATLAEGRATLTFTPADWFTPQPVTVTGIDDALARARRRQDR